MIDCAAGQVSGMKAFSKIRDLAIRRSVSALLLAAVLMLACRRSAPPAPANPRSSAQASPPSDRRPAAEPRRLPAPAPDPGYGLRPSEKAAVEGYLAGHPDLRVATDEDSRRTDESDDMAKLYRIYHPYFVRGDVDDDGQIDFVLAFVDRTKPAGSTWFTVAVFRSDSRGGYRPALELERQVSLEAGDLAIDRDSILVTPDLAQDTGGRRYRWNPQHEGFDFVSDDEGTVEERPSSRI